MPLKHPHLCAPAAVAVCPWGAAGLCRARWDPRCTDCMRPCAASLRRVHHAAPNHLPFPRARSFKGIRKPPRHFLLYGPPGTGKVRPRARARMKEKGGRLGLRGPDACDTLHCRDATESARAIGHVSTSPPAPPSPCGR